MREDFWNDNQEAQTILKNISTLQEPVDKFHQFWQEANYLNDMLDMAENENEPELLADTVRELENLLKQFREFEMEILFSGPHDAQDAIVAMHAGAGGTEAQDWVQMLLRMYTRWCESNGYRLEILDFLDGDEAGIKSVTFMVHGKFAYGKLRCEQGVHRLIRISPFDASGRRHTSFASLSVMPDIEADMEVLRGVRR